jgi:hypothetical protein
MTELVIFSEDAPPVEWAEVEPLKLEFGPKGAALAAIPRSWTPPFALVSARMFVGLNPDGRALPIQKEALSRIREIARITGQVCVRSSVIGETIWDRGRYHSEIVGSNSKDFYAELASAVTKVLTSAPGKRVGLVIQSYVSAEAQGEFGNLLSVSKTRDHWELNFKTQRDEFPVRFNTQRDEAADPLARLEIRAGVPRERLFGSIAAWLNNNLLRGQCDRVNCEWIISKRLIYLVQLDREDEDFAGTNPLQLNVPRFHQPNASKGSFLAHADGQSLQDWDKLKVLKELWEPSATHKPTLFYVTLPELPRSDDHAGLAKLEDDFRNLVGPNNIVVRTSGRAGVEKQLNLCCTNEGGTPNDVSK